MSKVNETTAGTSTDPNVYVFCALKNAYCDFQYKLFYWADKLYIS